jgi:hypothetical protein
VSRYIARLLEATVSSSGDGELFDSVRPLGEVSGGANGSADDAIEEAQGQERLNMLTERVGKNLMQLLDDYSEMRSTLDGMFRTSESDNENHNDEVECALITELMGALQEVTAEDYMPEDVASLISSITESLEEVDPTIFDHKEDLVDVDDEEDDDQDG